MVDENQKKSFWGTTLNRLKSVLAKTKEQVSAEEASEAEPAALEPVGALTQPTAGEGEREQSQATSHAPAASSQATVEKRAVNVDEEYIENLEEKLIKADLGLTTVEGIIADLRKESRGKSWTSHDVENLLKREFGKILSATAGTALSLKDDHINVFLIVGVNGVGKTTSIGKLASRFKADGRKVLLAAGDTFRAAAESQLEIWSQRAGVDIVRLQDGADPGAVVYKAMQKAREESYDILLIDTAGRLHNKTNLMAELKKVRSVIEKNMTAAGAKKMNLEALLVLDASTGQNGLQQAKVFTEVCGLTGVILTKLDGTAKGGVVFAVARELKIPVKLIGIGEKMEDLRDFDAGMFVEALF